MGKGIFVTGTDTGVGKTLVTAGLAALLKEKGFNIGVMKPVESGCRQENGQLFPEDAVFLKRMAGSTDELELINPHALKHPLAPALAAEIEGVEIKLEMIKQSYQILASHHSLVLVEGAGGLLTPLEGNRFMADLVQELELPLLVVAGAQLGTINHTLLTLHCARQKGIKVLGVIMNHTSKERGLAGSLNPGALQRWGGVPFLGVVPFLPSSHDKAIKRAIEENINLKSILKEGF